MMAHETRLPDTNRMFSWPSSFPLSDGGTIDAITYCHEDYRGFFHDVTVFADGRRYFRFDLGPYTSHPTTTSHAVLVGYFDLIPLPE